MAGFVSSVGPIVVVTLTGTSWLSVLNSSFVLLSFSQSFVQPALFVAKFCPEVPSSTFSSIVVFFFCFYPSASSWKSSKRCTHLSFALTLVGIFERLNFGIVIVLHPTSSVYRKFLSRSPFFHILIYRGLFLLFLFISIFLKDQRDGRTFPLFSLLWASLKGWTSEYLLLTTLFCSIFKLLKILMCSRDVPLFPLRS